MKKLRAASILSFAMAIIFGISSIFTFTVRADEDGTAQVEEQAEISGENQVETQSASDGDTVRKTYGSAFGDGSNESILNPSAPTGYDAEDTANPYGAKLGEPMLLFQQAELFAYYGSKIETNTEAEVNAYANAAVYDTREGTDASNVLGANWNVKGGIDYGSVLGKDKLYLAKSNFVQTVELNPNSNGRDDHVAFIGVYKCGQ